LTQLSGLGCGGAGASVSLINRPLVPLLFPNLNPTDFYETSAESPLYNCVAWVLGDITHWWDPSQAKRYFRWLPDLPRNNLVETYISLFERHGFEICADGQLEPGFLKICLYASSPGRFKHVTLQLPDGRWSSKLGEWEDISHANVSCLEGPNYGSVIQYMRRPVTTAAQRR
jgi:hypothetical protein